MSSGLRVSFVSGEGDVRQKAADSESHRLDFKVSIQLGSLELNIQSSASLCFVSDSDTGRVRHRATDMK